MALLNLTKKLDQMDRSYYNRPKKGRALRRVINIVFICLILVVLPIFFIAMGLKDVALHSKSLIAAYNLQNYDQIKKEIVVTKTSLQKIDFSLNFLFWLKIIPFLGGYYQDAKGFSSAGVEGLKSLEIIFSLLENSKDELGFKGVAISGPDRVTQGIKFLEKSIPLFPKIEGNLQSAANSVKNINTEKYPEAFRGTSVKSLLSTVKNFILGANIATKEGYEALVRAPQALGIPISKNYLLLFQNDKEIRPTGGFITAFATLKIDNGQIQTNTSDDIYRLDEKLLNVCLTKICPLTPPPSIVKYLPEVSGKPRSAWSMRDSNISPDLPSSAKEFERMYQLLGEGLPFDGIIFIDSQVVEELIEVTGPIDVFGTTFSSEVDKRCNCPNVIYELEAYAEIAAKGEQDRKAILGVLMQQILARSVGADVEKIPQLIETIARLANHKHIIFYIHDDATQKALSKLNWTGEIKSYEGDYLHINDANFAGGKSNLYVEQTVTQEITVKNGEVKKKITIDYKNPQKFNTWLNGINRDYVRFYVPKGSKLISSKGSEVTVTTIEDDLGKNVFEAFIQVRPENSRKLEIEYEIPYNPGGEYKLLIQKQPGAKDFHYIIKINGSKKADFNLESDREFRFNL